MLIRPDNTNETNLKSFSQQANLVNCSTLDDCCIQMELKIVEVEINFKMK